jgi:sugar lactone lactonase YvrE
MRCPRCNQPVGFKRNMKANHQTMKTKLQSLILILSVFCAGPVIHAQSVYEPYALYTLAGTPPGSSDGTGSAARFNGPNATVIDGAGNLFVADGGNHTIRKITPSGVVTTFAGLGGVSGTADGTGTAARFNGPAALAIDSAGNFFVTDSGNNTIRKITPSGVVTTFAGQAGVAGGNDGPAASATFFTPNGIVINGAGTMYIADQTNNTIRAISTGGTVSTLAGSPGLGGSADGTGSAARFSNPTGLALDSAGTIYVADNVNNKIRTVTPGGVVTTLAGTGAGGFANGPANTAVFSQPNGVAVDGSGNVFVADSNNSVIREISGGFVTTFAGALGPGNNDGPAATAHFNLPTGVTIAPSGNFYVADSNNSTIRVISPSLLVSTLAGSPAAGTTDGTGSAALFDFPQGIALDASGNAYVADTNADTIRKITPSGVVTTIAGSPYMFGNTDGTGSTATFAAMRYIASDSAGNIFVPNTLAHTIRKITPSGVVTTIAGIPFSPGSTDGPGTVARFRQPRGIAVDPSGNLYVADSNNDTIRKIDQANVVTTLAGSPGQFGTADGVGSAARFAAPRGVAIDSQGNLFVADQGSGVIRKVTPAGVVTTFAGSPGNFGAADGTGSAATFVNPAGLSIDQNDNIYVADTGSNVLRKITPAGATTTLAGLPFTSGTADGVGSAVRFGSIRGVAVSSQGNVYITDAGNHVVKVSTPLPQVSGFVIGDLNSSVGSHVTFWGAQWAQQNALSGGSAPKSFKGFGAMPSGNPPSCGQSWATNPGNSSTPPATVPQFINVIVTSSVNKSGSRVSGTISKIATIQVDPGYSPDPGTPGTGTVTAVICQ